MSENITPSFEQLGLNAFILSVLESMGYVTPTPVQTETIPLMIANRDVLAQAQTGTGKTAAFALPVLQKLDLKKRCVQCLVLAPTRELAIQVAEAFREFGKHTKGFKVTAIYGGDEYRRQLKDLNDGAQVVVGTPGRVMDHMRRGTLKIDNLSHLILDEADEMLRMGFVDDVEWILSHTPDSKQTALFSATMPSLIRKIAQKYLTDPKEVTIKQKTATVERIRQRVIIVQERNKLDVLTRILEAEKQDGIIIFTRTKTATLDISERLGRLGLKVEALNGDIAQANRKRTVDRLKSGAIDIIVATDVAARGIDIERVSCVVNYDIPFDNETYVHRIGRTGRAGREGDAILFVTPREQRLFKNLERAIKTTITKMTLPTVDVINEQRIAAFKETIKEVSDKPGVEFYKSLLSDLAENSELDMLQIAATLAHLAQGKRPLLLKERGNLTEEFRESRGREREGRSRDRVLRFDKKPSGRSEGRSEGRGKPSRVRTEAEEGMSRYRLEVGRQDGVKPGNIVGAIANEANMSSKNIGHIQINDKHTFVDLPQGMSAHVVKDLSNVWVCGKKLSLSIQ